MQCSLCSLIDLMSVTIHKIDHWSMHYMHGLYVYLGNSLATGVRVTAGDLRDDVIDSS